MVCGRHSSSMMSSKCASMLHREMFLLIDYYDDCADSNYTFVDNKFSYNLYDFPQILCMKYCAPGDGYHACCVVS